MHPATCHDSASHPSTHVLHRGRPRCTRLLSGWGQKCSGRKGKGRSLTPEALLRHFRSFFIRSTCDDHQGALQRRILAAPPAALHAFLFQRASPQTSAVQLENSHVCPFHSLRIPSGRDLRGGLVCFPQLHILSGREATIVRLALLPSGRRRSVLYLSLGGRICTAFPKRKKGARKMFTSSNACAYSQCKRLL